MKLRIRGNTVRVRLTQTEVGRLAAGETIEEVTRFSPTATLVASIEMGEVAALAVTFDGAHLLLRVPAKQARRWAESEDVGIEGEQAVGEGERLQLLVEKDFQCLHSKAAEELDAYPNPRETAS